MSIQELNEVIKSGVEDASFGQQAPNHETGPIASPVTGVAIHNSNHQSQIITQDFTTINNIFRSELKATASFSKKIGIELLLSIIEPDRFLKNAKAVFIITAAYYIMFNMSSEQIEKIIHIYLSK